MSGTFWRYIRASPWIPAADIFFSFHSQAHAADLILRDNPMPVALNCRTGTSRRGYREFLRDGEFRDQVGAEVIARDPRRFFVFNAGDTRRVVVVVNQDFYYPITVTVKLPQVRRLGCRHAGKSAGRIDQRGVAHPAPVCGCGYGNVNVGEHCNES